LTKRGAGARGAFEPVLIFRSAASSFYNEVVVPSSRNFTKNTRPSFPPAFFRRAGSPCRSFAPGVFSRRRNRGNYCAEERFLVDSVKLKGDHRARFMICGVESGFEEGEGVGDHEWLPVFDRRPVPGCRRSERATRPVLSSRREHDSQGHKDFPRLKDVPPCSSH